MDELIQALATLGITVPEGTAFADLPKVLKANKKTLKAHDDLAAAKADGPSDAETEEPETKTDDPETKTEEPETKTEEPETKTDDPKVPAKVEVTKEPATPQKSKNKFVTQR